MKCHFSIARRFRKYTGCGNFYKVTVSIINIANNKTEMSK
jgi:hypothetical protein